MDLKNNMSKLKEKQTELEQEIVRAEEHLKKAESEVFKAVTGLYANNLKYLLDVVKIINEEIDNGKFIQG